MSSKVEIPREIALAFGRSHVTGRDMSDGVMAYMGTKLSWSLSHGCVFDAALLGHVVKHEVNAIAAFITGAWDTHHIYNLHLQGKWHSTGPLAAVNPPLDVDMRAVQGDAIIARLDDKAVAKAAADFYLKRGHVNFAYAGAVIADRDFAWNKSEEVHDRIRRDAFARYIAKSKHACFDFTPPRKGSWKSDRRASPPRRWS